METDKRIFYLLAFIFSLIGGILVLATSFTCMYAYYTICMFIGSEYMGAYDSIVIVMGIFLLLSGIISLGLMLKPDLENKNILRLDILLSLLALVLVIVGIIISAIEYEDTEWSPEAGFYGGFFGSIISMLCIFMAYREQGILKTPKTSPSGPGIICKNCGAPQKQPTKFCQNCGAAL